MTAKLKKRGDSIGVKIPREIAIKAGLTADSEIIIEYADQKIVILPKKQSPQLEDLLSQVTKGNCHPEIFYDRIGKEVW